MNDFAREAAEQVLIGGHALTRRGAEHIIQSAIDQSVAELRALVAATGLTEDEGSTVGMVVSLRAERDELRHKLASTIAQVREEQLGATSVGEQEMLERITAALATNQEGQHGQ